MSQESLVFQNISFSYETASYYLFDNLSAHFSAGWTGIVGANGAGKTTILRLASGELKPNCGHIRGLPKAIYCAQRTDNPPERLANFLDSSDTEAYRLKGVLGLRDDWLCRWDTLSHGERKRAQLAVGLWLMPDCLAIDEPTNHLDSGARTAVKNALKLFRGVGILVSHDRDLLDSLCHQCLFVDPPDCIMRPGGYTEALEHHKREQEHLIKRRKLAKDKFAKLKVAAKQRQDIAATARRRISKKGISPKDKDAKSKIDMARMSGKDATGGKLLRQLDGRLEQAKAEIDSIQVKKTYKQGIWLESSSSKRDVLFRMPSQSISLGEYRSLQIPDIAMKPADRIGLRGLNGAGKSTLINMINRGLELEPDKVIYLPQEITIEKSNQIMTETKTLPKVKLGHLMTIISALGSRPERVLETELLSPGELRKLMLAIGITNNPHLIMMDEPTNHLDLPSIECLEEALSSCQCGLLLVSHDNRFLDALCYTFWEISEGEAGKFVLKAK